VPLTSYLAFNASFWSQVTRVRWPVFRWHNAVFYCGAAL